MADDMFFNIPVKRIELGVEGITRDNRISGINNDELKAGLYAPIIEKRYVRQTIEEAKNHLVLTRDNSFNITAGVNITASYIYSYNMDGIAVPLNIVGDDNHLDVDITTGTMTLSTITALMSHHPSDERIKTNIQEASYENAYALIKDISINSYDYVDGNRSRQNFGFVAQQVNGIMPEVVKTAPGNYTAEGKFILPDDTTTPIAISDLQVVDKNSLFQLLFAGFKHSQQEIETLKQRITTLENS